MKRHVGNTKGVKLNMKNFFFQAIEGIKTLKALDIILEDIEKYIGDVVGFKVENILYLYIYKPRIIGKHRKDIGGQWKGPQN